MPKRIICDVSNPKKVIQREEEFELTPEELEQQEKAQAAQQRKEVQEANRLTLQDRAVKAIKANNNYLASDKTNAKAIAQVDALTRQVNAIIRLLVSELDETD